MASSTIQLCLLALVACPLSNCLMVLPEKGGLPSARSRLVEPDDSKKPTNVEKPKNVVEKAVKKTVEVVDKAVEHMLSPIDAMRGELCMARNDMIGHSDCMEWLVDECLNGSFGTGLCRRVKAHVKEECEAGNTEACDYAKQLGLDVNMPIEKEEQDSKPVAAPAPAPTSTPEKAAPATPEKAAPAPAEAKKEEPASAEAPAPAKKEEAKKPEKKEAKEAEKSAPDSVYEDPDAKEGLASQGFSGAKVLHEDGKTATGDWGNEYGSPRRPEPPKSGAESRCMHPLTYAAIALLAWFYIA